MDFDTKQTIFRLLLTLDTYTRNAVIRHMNRHFYTANLINVEFPRGG